MVLSVTWAKRHRDSHAADSAPAARLSGRARAGKRNDAAQSPPFAMPHASTNASFGLSEPKRGLVPGAGSMVRLPRQVPWARAMEILMTGDPVSAEEALAMGFVNYVVEPEELMPRALEFAERLKQNAPLAVAAVKEAALRTSGLPLEEAYAIENEVSARVSSSEDAREGPRAFMEKRDPVWTGH